MRLTTKGRFAVNAMLDIALEQQSGAVALARVSSRQKISLPYLEQLFKKLRQHTLVVSTRGPGGGYRLARPASAISIADIIIAADEIIEATQCAGKKNCRDVDSPCMTHNLWANLNKNIFNYLASISLETLIKEQKNRHSS